LGRAAKARRDSVRIGMLATAETPAAKRKKERRERPLQPVGSTSERMVKTP
jgi:hypothetical protein